MKLDDETLQKIVEAVVARIAESESDSSAQLYDRRCSPESTAHFCTADPRPIHSVVDPVFESVLPRLVELTSSQIAVGRAGNRFRTDLYLRAREGHADARDAVHSAIPDDWATQNGLIALHTQCKDRHEYLLHPNLGRSLDSLSAAVVDTHKNSSPDVQIVVGDGLSPNAILQNGAQTLQALKRALHGAGMRTGTDFFVRYARIAVADEIGVRTQARATVILVGERPGLGTGDSLSLYLAIKPRIAQDNAEKNCISNVRPIGIHPEEAASQSVAILKRGFEKGIGGVALGLGWGRQ